MCGRYTICMDIEDVLDRWQCYAEESSVVKWQPRYNLAPTQQGLVVTRTDKGNMLQVMKWGLVPRWAKDLKIGSRLINARLESIAEKPAFREAFKRHRCIIPADGFYEWQKDDTRRIPMRIVLENEGLFGFAGLWDTWYSPEGVPVDTFTIITTEPVDAVRAIHNRMPLILPPDLDDVWLKGPAGTSKENMQDFLESLRPDDRLRAYRVSPLVNKPANDGPELIVPV